MDGVTLNVEKTSFLKNDQANIAGFTSTRDKIDNKDSFLLNIFCYKAAFVIIFNDMVQNRFRTLKNIKKKVIVGIGYS